MTDPEIKPCPFCGSHSHSLEETDGWSCEAVKAVLCSNCGATGPTFSIDAADDEVVGAWNYQGVF